MPKHKYTSSNWDSMQEVLMNFIRVVFPTNAPVTRSGVQRFFYFIEETCYRPQALHNVSLTMYFALSIYWWSTRSFALSQTLWPPVIFTSPFWLIKFILSSSCLPHLGHHWRPWLSISLWTIEIYDLFIKYTVNITVTYTCFTILTVNPLSMLLYQYF